MVSVAYVWSWDTRCGTGIDATIRCSPQPGIEGPRQHPAESCAAGLPANPLARVVRLGADVTGPAFGTLDDSTLFASAAVDHGTVVWLNGFELDVVVRRDGIVNAV